MNGRDGAGTQVSAREILTVIFRRRVPIILCAVIVAAAALTAASRTKALYSATAKVLLRRIGASPLATTWTPFYGLEEEMNTEIEIASTVAVMECAAEMLRDKGVFVVSRIGDSVVRREPSFRDVAAGLSADPVEKSNIILVSYRGADPKFVEEAANAAASAYVEHRIPVRKATGLDEYFREQLTVATESLLDLKETELALKKEGQIYDIEWQQRTTISRESELSLRLADIRTRRVAEEQALAAIHRRLEESPDLLMPFTEPKGGLFKDMLAQYWRLRTDRDHKAAILTESNPEIRMLDDQIERMKHRFREEVDRVILDKQFLIEDLREEELALQEEIDKISERLRKTPEILAQLEHLQREIYYTYLHYDRLLEKMLTTTVTEANDVRLSNAKVISPARVTMTRAGRMKTAYIAFSILLGITLGIGFGFLLENLDHSVKSADDVEEIIGVPLLGSVPETTKISRATRRVDRMFENRMSEDKR